MNLFIFLVSLAVVYAHHGDPDLHSGQNCSLQCQDQCLPCKDLCQKQSWEILIEAISRFQMDCQKCQQQCQQCLTSCHDRGYENGVKKNYHLVIDNNGIQRALRSVDQCRMCMTQCKACQVQCIGIGSQRQDCSDCEQKCQLCSELCHHRYKRHDYNQKQPVPSCQEKCQSLCSHGKSEYCQNCLRECESGQGRTLGKLEDGQSGQNDSEQGSQQQPIPLGSCRKCMTYCNLCEVQCKNSKLGQPNCNRCHERCSRCREMCSSGSRAQQDQGDTACQGQCQNVCSLSAEMYVEACKDCLNRCNQGQGSDQGDGQKQQPVTQDCQRCRELCSYGQGKHCSDCLNRCQIGQGGDQGDGQGQKPILQYCQRCRGLCAHGTGKHCSDCLSRCQGGGQDQPVGQGGN